ncbi:hypothetical protein [Chryseobacterium sp.]|uniref:hypothetical protein n=1 Tax=Chryseobacterium sp. TaxID=1871047 RepID=UPI0028A18B8B|nr:hypothetical protein [Chryseobacterium sp.]
MKSLSLLFFLISTFCFSQEKEIVKILNEQIKKEIRDQFENPYFDGDTLTMMKEFSINNKILSVQMKKSNGFRTVVETQEVPISKISSVGKDINIIFDAMGNDVKIKSKKFSKDDGEEVFESDSEMFFTYIHFPGIEYVGNDLLKAFEKAGFKINKNYWYD